MKRAIVIGLIACGIAAFQANAQKSLHFIGTGGWGVSTPYSQQFNNYNLVTITGSVYSIDTLTPIDGMEQGIVMVVKDNSGQEFNVHLGPRWYIVRQDANLKPGDLVEVHGSRFSCQGKAAYAAFVVLTPEREMLLRDDDGIPYWCGWRKRKT